MLTNTYLVLFSSKNLEELSNMYSDDIVLSEWNENVFQGKEFVLKANNDLFEKFHTINIHVVNQGADNNTSLNELVIEVESEAEKAVVKVVDIITFDETTEKIKSITAYKGWK